MDISDLESLVTCLEKEKTEKIKECKCATNAEVNKWLKIYLTN
jgi:hypothetical protein